MKNQRKAKKTCERAMQSYAKALKILGKAFKSLKNLTESVGIADVVILQNPADSPRHGPRHGSGMVPA